MAGFPAFRWSWTAFITGLVVGVPVGVVGLIFVLQCLAAMISLP